MKSGPRWHLRGIPPQTREAAREAARRSGMSVGQWLDTIIIDQATERGIPLPSSDRAQPRHPSHDDLDQGTAPAMPPRHAETFTPPPFANGEFIPGTAPEPRRDPAPAQPLWQAYQPAAMRSEERATVTQENPPSPYPPFAGEEFAEVKERLDTLARKLADGEGLADVKERLDTLTSRLAQDDGLSEVKDRLETLTQKLAQDDGLAEVRQRLDNLTQQIAQDDGLTEITGRLDSLTQQLESMARLNAAGAQTPPAEQPDPTDQVTEVVSRLDRRLDEMVADNRSTRNEIEERLRDVHRAVADIGVDALRPRAASTGDASLDQAMAEIADRQRALDDVPAAHALPRAQTQDLAGLEQQLRQINEQMGTLRPGFDKAVDLLRDDLAEIGVMLQDAMPRKAIEALEADMRKLSERIDQSKEAGAGGLSLVGIERGLAEVRDSLHMLTPAENLAGLGETVKVLADKVDLIANNSQDPEAIKQLEGAIVAMRSIVTHVASNDALATLTSEVRALSARVDQVTGPTGSSDILATLEQRIAKLADALEAHNRDNQNVPHELDKVLSGLSAKLELLQSARTDEMALGHLEDRITNLVQKLDASDQRLNHLEGIERGIADLVKHLEQQRLPAVARGSEPAPEVDALMRDVSGLKQMEQQTQDSLEAVHGALEIVVERLATIESDIRDRISQAVSAAVAPTLAANVPPPPAPPSEPAPAATVAPAPVPVYPAARPASEPQMQELRPAEPKSEQRDMTPAPGAPEPPKASDKPPVLAGNPMSPVSSLTAPIDPTATPLRASPPATGERRPIDPNLPPDHPLEPGVSRNRYPGSPAERIAASEAAIGLTKPPVIADPGGKSNFIAAARRAAQAASEAPARPAARAAEAVTPKASAAPTMFPSLIRRHARSLIIAVSVLAIVLSSINIVANWLADQPEGAKSGHTATSPANGAETNTGEPTTAGRGSQNQKTTPAPAPAPAPGATTSDRQSSLVPPPNLASPGAVTTASTSTVVPPQPAAPRVAQATAPAASSPQVAMSPASGDQLPEAIGGALRTAATNGDPAAQYEVAQRFADGRGVPQNLPAAAEWYERAAKQGLAPAQFRLGGLFEKGIGVKKNLDAARRFYELAGEAGNAKALHNLAVLYAEGMDGKPDYQAAANWFRKAAAYGMADSQYNLGVLYARGIGVEQNLVDAYRWFGLAARNGDKESERKRDELTSRLDQTSLKAAKQSIDAFTPEAQPDAATQVKAPAGGWEPAAAPTSVPPANKRRSATPGARQEAAIQLDLATPQPRP